MCHTGIIFVLYIIFEQHALKSWNYKLQISEKAKKMWSLNGKEKALHKHGSIFGGRELGVRGITVKKYSTLRMCKISCSCLSLTLYLSLLSVGAKSHVSTASGCVDSFTNRNVKRHTQGGLRDKGGSWTGQETEQTWPTEA